MDKKTIQAMLQDELEKEIPTSDIHLWQTVKTNLVAGKKFQQGEKMKPIDSRRIPRAAFVMLILVVLVSLAFVTPQGRAFAQNILQFFVRADQDRYPLQAWQMTPPAQTSLESPFKLSVQEAETLAGYDVFSPIEPPSGMIFVGASYDEKYHIVAQAFGQNSDFIELSLWQQPLEYYQSCGDISHRCDNMLGGNLIGASADIQTVQIGDVMGEYVEGVWELTATGPVWRDDPFLKTLRWQKNDMAFELISGLELEKDGLVAIAESIK